MSTDRRPSEPRRHTDELLAHVRWSPEQLAAHQRTLLDDLLRHAVAASPFYRRTLGPDAVAHLLPSCPRWPSRH